MMSIYVIYSHRESSGEMNIIELQQKIPGAELLNMDNLHALENYKDAVLIFMGAGDIHKFQEAYENLN